MNRLSINRQAQVIKVLCEGNSIRSTARITGASINTVVKLLTAAGAACIEYQNRNLKHLTCKRIECDEIWSFCYAREKNVPEDKKGKLGYGDVWTFVAMDADSKLVLSWHIGWREPEDAFKFAMDIKGRVDNRIQLSTDGHKMYYEAVNRAFYKEEIDYAMLIKRYGSALDEHGNTKNYPKCIGAKPKRIRGNPDMSKVSTSYIERQNLTMRMGMRRFTRLTNGFSKKLENHKYSIALHFMNYNFVKPHKSLANPYPRTPAMASGISDHIWTFEEIVKLTV